MAKTIVEVVCAYKKESNPNKKVKILAICHLLENEKTITEVSKILFKAYNTIKNWWQAFKKDGIRGLETKKIPGRPPKIKNKTLLEFMETKTKEGQYIVPEDIARDLKNELDVDYSPSGMRNTLHRINYTCKTMEPRHSNMQSVEDVLEWQHDMKRWFSRLKKDKIDVWCNDTTTLRHDIARRFGLWAPEGQRVFGTYYGNHISRFINGAVSLSGKRFFTATNTLATPVVIDFFTDLLKWRGKIAAILDRASWNKSGKMKQFLADNEERIYYRYFPVGWPQLNPTEGFWNTLKRNSLMHEHYDNVDERVGRALYFLQNSRINIDCETYIFRDPKPIANLF